MKILLILLSIPLISNFGFSQTIVTDRPDQTESSLTVPKNGFQIESGTYLEVTPLKNTILLPTSLFRIGISKRIELRVFSQIERQKTDSSDYIGISDLELGTKIQLFKSENSPTEIAFLSHFAMPLGSQNLTSYSYGIINKLILSHQLTTNIKLGYNLGWLYYNNAPNSGVFTLSFAVGLSDKMGVYVEPYTTFESVNNYKMNVDAGFTYLIKNNLQFDYSIGLGLNNRMNYQSIGISWLIQ